MKNISSILILLIGLVSLNAQTILSENFEGGVMPTGWTVESQATDGGWLVGTSATLSSQYWPIPAHTTFAATNDDDCNCNKMSDRLITPSIDLSMYSGTMISCDVYFNEGTYSNLTERAYVEASIDGGSTWSVVQQLSGEMNWVNLLVDVSQYAGNANVKFAFKYSDMGGWLFGFAIDNIEIFAPQMYDIAAKSITTNKFLGLNSAPFEIKGTIKNLGSTTINSIDLNYKIDNGQAVTVNITGLNIAPLDIYSFIHPTQWNPLTTGIYNVTVWASNLNGNADQNQSNDEFSMDVEVVANWIEKKLLHEVFTSSTCGPCVAGNQTIGAVISNNPTRYTIIKYQMSWPPPGDPYYTAEGGVRKTYYGVSAVPHMMLNGGWNNDPRTYTQAIFEQFYFVPAFMEIDATHIIDANAQSVEVQVAITPHQDFPAGLKLHIAVVENKTTGNVGSNGETEFHYVMMKMVPNASGTDIGPLTTGNQTTYTKTASLAGTNIEEFTDLSVVVFVQTNSSKDVHQSAWSVDNTVGINENEEIITGIYPNPANDFAMLNYNLTDNSDVSINIYSITGELVFSSNSGNQPAGDHQVKIDTKNLSNGVYSFHLKVNGNIITRKLVVCH